MALGALPCLPGHHLPQPKSGRLWSPSLKLPLIWLGGHAHSGGWGDPVDESLSVP